MDARRTPDAPIAGLPRHTPDPTLERGFVASLRWLVAEGDARGVRRIAVELRALREALATIDETRDARDEQAVRTASLEREIERAIGMLGEATRVNGNGSLTQRLARLKFLLRRDLGTRQTLITERDSWRAMCEWQTRTRAMMHEWLEESERRVEGLEGALGVERERAALLDSVHQDTLAELEQQRTLVSEQRDALAEADARASRLRARADQLEATRAELDAELAELTRLRERVTTLTRERDIAAADARDSADALRNMRQRLHGWSGTVERALAELTRATQQVSSDGPFDPPT